MPAHARNQVTSDLEAFRDLLRQGIRDVDASALLLGLRAFRTHDLLRQIEKGLPYEAIEHLHRSVGIDVDDLADMVQMSRRSLARRRQEGRFQSDESDRLIRAARVFGKALLLFEGDVDAARGWLTSPKMALGDLRPLDMAKTEVGSRAVETFIDQIEYGVYV